MHGKPSKFRVGLVQMAMSSDPQANEAKAAAKVEEAARLGAQVVCLPEMYRTPYFCQREDAALFDLAEPVAGPSRERFCKVAKQAGVAVVVPIFERRAPGLYHNSAVVIDADGRQVGLYRKMHIPDDPVLLREVLLHARGPGLQGLRHAVRPRSACSSAGTSGTRRPRGSRRCRARTILFYPTAIGWHPAREGGVRRARSATPGARCSARHAIANGVLRRGGEPRRPRGRQRRQRRGSSSGAPPSCAIRSGVLVAEASVDKEEMLIG